MRRLLIAALLLTGCTHLPFIPTPNVAHPFRDSVSIHLTLFALDMGSTRYAVRHGAVEGNPVLSGLRTTREAKAVALETVFILGSKWIKDRDVAWWWMPMYGVDLVRAVVISRNIVGGLKR